MLTPKKVKEEDYVVMSVIHYEKIILEGIRKIRQQIDRIANGGNGKKEESKKGELSSKSV